MFEFGPCDKYYDEIFFPPHESYDKIFSPPQENGEQTTEKGNKVLTTISTVEI